MKDFEKKNYYELLGVEQNATEEEIKIAFKEIALVYHPDSNFFSEIVDDNNLSEEDNSLFKALTTAYQTLSNKQKRAEYDIKLQKENLSKGIHKTEDWIRPDGRSASLSTVPKQRQPTVTDLQHLQKKYQERSKMQTVSVAQMMAVEKVEDKNSNYSLIIAVMALFVVIIAIILFLI